MNATRTVHCNRCGAATIHSVVYASPTLYGWVEECVDGDSADLDESDDIADPENADWHEQYELLRCRGCDTVTVRQEIRGSKDTPAELWDEDQREPRIVNFYPPRLFRKPPRWHHVLPADIRSVLGEVNAALATDSRRLAIMGARAVIDMVLVQKVGDVGNFRQKLEALESRGHISRVGREHLAAALDAGSAAAHRGYLPDVPDVENTMEIVENLLHSAYVLSPAADALKSSTPRRPRPH